MAVGLLWGGLHPRAGALRLIVLRWLGLGACAAGPAILIQQTVGDEIGHAPQLATDAVASASVRFYMVEAAGPVFLGGVVAAAVLFLFLDQLLAASLLRVVDPHDPPHPVRIWKGLWRDSFGFLPPFVRVILWCAALGGIGLAGLGWVFEPIGDAAQKAGTTGMNQIVVLTAIRAGLTGIWLTLVGVWGLWCRVLLVADRRFVVRRVGWNVLRIFWRAPAAFWAPVLLIFGVQLVGSPLLAWAWYPDPGAALGVLWFLYIGLQVILWYAVLHGMRRLYDRREFDDLRVLPDAGWKIPSRLLARLRRR